MSLVGGQVFAGYTILRVLGAGAMGTVYLVRHPRLPRQEALKVLPVELTADAQYRARFVREADLAAGLSHPHIVGVHDRGESEGQFWISMDYVAGTDAARLLREHYPQGMPAGEALPIVVAVGSALDYAHHCGLLHRDVKPANVLLTEPVGQSRRVFLADFGIARRIEDPAGLTATDMAVGTVAYAAPEQLMGASVDGRADQYALACTAFHLLTGAPPFDYSNPAVVVTKHVSAPPPSIGARRGELAGLDGVFAVAMAKQPSSRFGSCQEFTDALGARLGVGSAGLGGVGVVSSTEDTQPGLGVAAPVLSPPPPPPPPPVGKRPRRRGVVIGVLVAALVGIVVLIAGGVMAGVTLTRHHHRATTAPPNTTAPNTAVAPDTAAAPNTGPFTGTYRADFGAATNLDNVPAPGQTPSTGTYAVHSVCRPTGCMATASRLSGEAFASTLVFDAVGGNWVAVALSSNPCRGESAEIWEVFTLQPRPDGTFTGEQTRTAGSACAEKRTVTFTRTGDVDVNSLPDPATLPPRVISPAEALHGHYHATQTFTNGLPQQQEDLAVTTDCLRTGDRCMSYFHEPSTDSPLVFVGGNWVLDIEHDQNISGCGQTHVKTTAQYPLPQPPRNPIPLLTGHGHHEQTGICSVSVDFDETYTRTGD